MMIIANGKQRRRSMKELSLLDETQPTNVPKTPRAAAVSPPPTTTTTTMSSTTISKPSPPPADLSVGGVYCLISPKSSSKSCCQSPHSSKNGVDTTSSGDCSRSIPKDASCTSLSTIASSEDEPSTRGNDNSQDTYGCCWIFSGAKDHHRNSPLLAHDPESHIHDKNCDCNPSAELGQILAKSRSLPSVSYFASNHVMVNRDRVSRTVAPLKRLRWLDELARQHARSMALQGQLYIMDANDLLKGLVEPHNTSRRLGVNVARGKTIRTMHKAMMSHDNEDVSHMNNILDRRFTNMGMGTATSSDGTLYLCQIFRG